jgi:hypothetical protein
MLTFARCEQVIEHTLGELPPGLDVLRTVNLAGEYLTSMHPWSYLLKAGYVQLVTDQVHAALPADFRSLEAKPTWGTTTATLELIDKKAYINLHNDGGAVAPPSDHYYCAVFPTSPTAGGEVTYQLQFWPIPELASGDAGVIGILYLAGWAVITDDDASTSGEKKVATMPFFLEGLFEEILRAYARGVEEEDTATLNQRLAEIERGPLFARAKARDGATDGPNGLPIRNGAAAVASTQRSGGYDRFNIAPVGDPS